jgi:tryptophan 7-halogenase
MIKNIIVLGGGSAGFIAAITLRRKLPSLNVRLIRSPDIGVIGVGEGTTQLFPRFLFEQLGVNIGSFYAGADPTWKLGIRFLWGPRPYFHYSFTKPVAARLPGQQRNTGFYLEEEFGNADLWYSLMEQDRALPRAENGRPAFLQHSAIAFHVENKKLVDYLERLARETGVIIQDAKVEHVERSEDGVAALQLEGGERLTADLYLDASGFRSELLGRALETPYVSYADTLFCDRAVIGAWQRTNEPIKPYTVAETMDHGWAWQIEHETMINRGYVYSSRFVDDDTARNEHLRKNPKANPDTTRVVKFRSGRFATMWQGNVVGIGNAAGFVEPLEASSLQVIILQCRSLADSLLDSECEPSPSVRSFYNQVITASWDEVRDFLAVHYKFNTRLDTPFWQTCRNEIDLKGAQPVCDFYAENGPSALANNYVLSPQNPYGVEGYAALLVGQKVPHRRQGRVASSDLTGWRKHAREHASIAQCGLSVREGLDYIRRPDWKWD